MGAALAHIRGDVRKVAISRVLGKDGPARAVELRAECVTFSYAGAFCGAKIALYASPDGKRFHAITNATGELGSEFIVTPPHWLTPPLIDPSEGTAIVCRLLARLRGA